MGRLLKSPAGWCLMAVLWAMAVLAVQPTFSWSGSVASQPFPSLQTLATPKGLFYYIVIPKGSGYQVVPAVSDKPLTVERFASAKGKQGPLFIINAGYFDPANGKTTSYVTQDYRLVLDPTTNERLTENESLKPYLPRIFDRSEFRLYDCQGAVRYNVSRHSEPVPAGCRIRHALGAGPELLPAYTAYEEGFIDTDARGQLTRDPIGVNRSNARSAVGITCSGDVILGMFSQIPEKYASSGVGLPELGDLMKQAGAVKVLSLDGGSSSSFWLNGKAYYGKYTKNAQPVKRPVKSVLMVVPASK